MDPQMLQMLAAALVETGKLPPPNSGQHTIPETAPDTWAERAYNAPRVGGQGSTPQNMIPVQGKSIFMNGQTPFGQDVGPAPTTPGGPGGQTPPDTAGAGRSPYIIDRIPELPPLDRTDMPIPIPTNSADWGNQLLPITNTPFGLGGLFGG